MKGVKRILSIVLPVVLVVVVALGIILPVSLAEPKPESKEPGPKFVTAYAGQVAYAAEGTGAASADKSEKGGAYYLDEGTSITHTGGTITGKSKTYGGAVYISNKATFTMNGGTISGCQAMYGGAIYVAAGGKCVIKGGTIVGNKAQVAPAIYVETGGTLEVADGVTIEDNTTAYWFPVSPTKEMMGGTYYGTQSSIELYTTTFGSYPQTYVGDDMNATLETWFSANSPSAVKSYTVRENYYNTTGVWPAYKYTDGELYVRERSYRYLSPTYKNGDSVPDDGTYVWFKVEPIKWYIMNYDAWKSGSEKIELFSEIVLTGYIHFNALRADGNSWETSYIRNWCNEKFYNEAFTDEEREQIFLTTVKNNVEGNYDTAESDGSGPDTEDYIYLKSYYEITHGIFQEKDFGDAARLCAPSDFALSNYCYMDSDIRYTTPYRGQGTTYYLLRSAGSASSASYVCCVFCDGTVYTNSDVLDTIRGVRPALQLNV